MDIGLEKKLNKKHIKDFTAAELAAYNHKRYEKDRKHRLEYQNEYYQKHKLELQRKANNRYRIKCGLGVIKWKQLN